jgi:hypothetical protein
LIESSQVNLNFLNNLEMALFTRPGLWQWPSSHTYPAGPCGTIPIGPPNAIPCFGGQPPPSAAPDHCRPPGPPLPPIACLTSRRTPPYLSTTHGIGPHPILFLTNAVRLVKKATVAPRSELFCRTASATNLMCGRLPPLWPSSIIGVCQF